MSLTKIYNFNESNDYTANLSSDGRHLSYFGYYETAVTEDVILEALSSYSAHAKTYDSALDFAKYITSNDQITMVNGELVFPQAVVDELI